MEMMLWHDITEIRKCCRWHMSNVVNFVSVIYRVRLHCIHGNPFGAPTLEDDIICYKMRLEKYNQTQRLLKCQCYHMATSFIRERVIQLMLILLHDWAPFYWQVLTHWGRVMHICGSKLTIIGSDNGLSPGRRQAFICTDAGILLIGPLGTKFSEILIEIDTFSFKKMHLKMSSEKWRPFCFGLNVLN